MRNVIIGVVIGLVVGIVLGSNVIGPNFDQRIPGLNEPATNKPVAAAGDTRTHALSAPAFPQTDEGGTPVNWAHGQRRFRLGSAGRGIGQTG